MDDPASAATHRETAEPPEPPARGPSIMLGLGLGGFVDGIVLHQVLQWHHMVSAEEPVDTVAGLEVNTMADGFFNLVEGLVNHHLLGVHHVRDDLGAPISWDLGFLASGVLLVALGWLWHRRGLPRA